MRTIGALALAMAVIAPAGGAEALVVAPNPAQAEVGVLANRIIAAANAGDMKTILAAWADGDHAIIDNFPPFSWRGTNALTAWLTDYGKEMASSGETNVVSKIGPPLYVRAEGDRFYAVFADDYSYERAGAPLHQALLWTFVAVRTPLGLKIESMAFTGGPKP